MLRRPIDFHARVRGHRLFGDSKTWRGVFVAVLGSIVAVALQRAIGHVVPAAIQIVDYAKVDPVSFGAAMGGGAMLGELPNSFVKRQVGIAPGATARGWKAAVFYVWDQVDLLTGVWPAILLWVRPSGLLVAGSFAVALLVHPLVALVGYAIGARRSRR